MSRNPERHQLAASLRRLRRDEAWLLSIAGSSAGYPVVFNILAYGASPSASGAANRTAMAAAMAAASVLGGAVFVPPGVFDVSGAPIVLPIGVDLIGEKAYGQTATLGSILAFLGGCGIVVSAPHGSIRNLLLVMEQTVGGGAPAIDFQLTGQGSAAHLVFDRCDIINSGNKAVPMIRCGTSAAPGDLLDCTFSRSRWTHATGATVAGVSLFGLNGTLNNTRFEQIQFNSDLTATAPCIDIEGQATIPGGSGVTNISMRDMLFESPAGGAIKLRSVSDSLFMGIWLGDLTNQQVANIIDIGQDTVAADSPPAANLLFAGVRSDSGTAQYPTIFCDATVGGTQPPILIACKLPWVSNNGGSGFSSFIAFGCSIDNFSGDAPAGFTGASGGFTAGQVTANAYKQAMILTALHNSTTASAIYDETNFASASATNYSVYVDTLHTYINGTDVAGLAIGGAAWFRAYVADQESLPCNASGKPIVGDSALNSPYGVHGYASVAMGAGGTISATPAQYKNGILKLIGNPGGAAVLQLPLGVYSKLIDNETAGGFVVTVQGPSGSGVALSATPGKTWVYCDGTNFN